MDRTSFFFPSRLMTWNEDTGCAAATPSGFTWHSKLADSMMNSAVRTKDINSVSLQLMCGEHYVCVTYQSTVSDTACCLSCIKSEMRLVKHGSCSQLKLYLQSSLPIFAKTHWMLITFILTHCRSSFPILHAFLLLILNYTCLSRHLSIFPFLSIIPSHLCVSFWRSLNFIFLAAHFPSIHQLFPPSTRFPLSITHASVLLSN